MSNLAMMMGLGSAGGGSIPSFVGFANGAAANGGAVTVDLSTIGIESGDLIIGAHYASRTYDLRPRMSISSTGYTLITSGYANWSYDISAEIYGKIADGTETTFVSDALNPSDIGASCVTLVGVFRGVGSTIPTDLASGLLQSGVATGTDDISWTGVTGLTSSDTIVCIGGVATVSAGILYDTPTDLDGFQSLGRNDSSDTTAAMGYKYITGDSFSPETWTIAATSSSSVHYAMIKLTSV